MLFRLAADAVLLVHLAFILFVVLGAILLLRWRWLALIHVPFVIWGVAIELSGWGCPLTPLEDALRERALAAGNGASPLGRLLETVVYPPGLTREQQFVLAALLLLVNFTLYIWLFRRRSRSKKK